VTGVQTCALPISSTYVGAPRYLAPELLQQDFFPGVIAPPLDIWALGCCVYYLASGKEICLREDGSFPKPLEEMLLAIPARFGTPLKNIIRACLCLHPEERPTARQVAHIANEELVVQENERQARIRNSKAIIDLFELIDEDQSGTIELDELLEATTNNRQVIRLLKKSERLRGLLQPEKVRPFFIKMDANGDGVLTIDEMLEFCQVLHSEPLYEKELLNQIVMLFNLIDRDHKLYIDKEELLESIMYRPDVVMVMEKHEKLALLLRPGTFEETFQELDTHHSGHVTLDELMEFVVSNHQEEETRKQERELQKAKARAWRQVDRERRKR
jgi:Ca2+-binding EF-hand superfamily protein